MTAYFFARKRRRLTERSEEVLRILSRTTRKGHKVSRTKMKDAGDILKIVGMVLLVLFVLAVGVPLVLAAAGVALGIIGMLVGLAIAVIKIAVVVAIIYLIIVGIRAVLR